MKSVSRLALRASILTTGAGMLLMASGLFMSPSFAYADDSATTTDSSVVVTSATSTTPVVATSTPEVASTTPSATIPAQTVSTTTPDTTNPTLSFAFSIPVSDPTGDNPIPVTATFSEPVTGFQASSLNIGAGHVDNFVEVSPTVYTFDVVVTVPNGTVSIDSNDGNVKDASGNIAIAAPQLHVRFDNTLANLTASSTTSGGTSTTTGSTGTSTTTAPWILFTGGPADGSTIATSSATFTFQTDGMSAISCAFGSVTSTYGCGSPQTFTGLVDGVYPFTVFANYMNQTASSTRTFTVDLEASSTTATSTDSTATSTDSTATSTDSTATSTDTTTTTNSTDQSSGGGVSGGTIYSGGFSGGSISGGSISGSTGGVSGSDSVLPVGTYVPGSTGTDYGTTGSGLALNDGIGGATGDTLADDAIGTTTASTTLTGALDDTAGAGSSTQEAAAANSHVGRDVLWGSLIIVILLLIGSGYWYSRRTV